MPFKANNKRTWAWLSSAVSRCRACRASVISALSCSWPGKQHDRTRRFARNWTELTERDDKPVSARCSIRVCLSSSCAVNSSCSRRSRAAFACEVACQACSVSLRAPSTSARHSESDAVALASLSSRAAIRAVAVCAADVCSSTERWARSLSSCSCSSS